MYLNLVWYLLIIEGWWINDNKMRLGDCMADSVKLLSSEQTQAFDTEYVDDSMFDLVIEALDKYQISQAPFTLMDVGGGNGKYVDKVLNHFARASAILVEPEPSLAQKNRPDERKQVLLDLSEFGITKPITGGSV